LISPREEPAFEVEELDVRVERLGTVLQPNGDPTEAGGILNPAAARTPDGDLLLYPRCVAAGNISRIGTVRASVIDGKISTKRMSFALEPEAPYELRPRPGYGCEDPRVTYVQALELYLMAYTAFGPNGPRIAVAASKDAYRWSRVGLVNFACMGGVVGDDKDAAFFPEPVLSPSGVRSIAFYHRPMLHLSAVDGRAALPLIKRMPFADRESIRIAYVPLAAVENDLANVLDVAESLQVLSPDARWGSIKIGAGTPPVRIKEGWMALFHGVDAIAKRGRKPALRYCAGIVIHDFERPDRIVYRSPEPVLTPTEPPERNGVVDNVVFPSGIDPRPDLGDRVFDVYYGMGDYSIGAFRLTLG
jgi:predicted GH43/DUF377 family glycosyl hydrolase